MLTTLTNALSSLVRRTVAASVENAILAGTADGVNAAAEKLGMTVEPDDLPEIPVLVLSPEPEPTRAVARRKAK